MTDSFNSLVKRARKGDRHAFSLLYQEIYADLYRYACFVLRNSQDAEDAVSEAVADAYATIGRLRGEDAFQKCWMFTIFIPQMQEAAAVILPRWRPFKQPAAR